MTAVGHIGVMSLLGTLPPFRRNEVAVPVARRPK